MASPKTTKSKRATQRSVDAPRSNSAESGSKSDATKKKRATSKSDATKKKRATSKSGGTKKRKPSTENREPKTDDRAPTTRDREPKTDDRAATVKDQSSKLQRPPGPPASERTPTPVPAPRVGSTVGVFESGKSNQARAVSVIGSLGFDIAASDTLEQMLTRLAEDPPDVVLVGLPEGQRIIEVAQSRGEDRPVVVAALPGPSTTAYARCVESGADLLAVRPLSRDALASTLHAAFALSKQRKQVISLRGTEAILRQRLQRYGQADNATGFQHVDFFKRQLVMEIKRAKRYGYSLAVCLVAIDPPKEGAPVPSEEATRKLRTRVASAITAAIREIDLPIDFADDRMLVFLPYTDIAGATSVGKRVAGAVKNYGTINDNGVAVSMSVSVGIAALRPGKPVSFARLMKEAGAAVRAAQLKGGGRIVVRK